MKKTVTIILILFVFNHVQSQEIHSAADILNIMSHSKIAYQVEDLKKSVNSADYSKKLNYNNTFRVVTDSVFSTASYNVKVLSEPDLKKAEGYFQAKDYGNALKSYKTALKDDSTLFFVMTYIGQMYEKQRDNANSIYWYKKAISHNYIDYMAHWFLADNYISTGNLKNSIDEIVIARILNRNNQRIKKSMNSIFLKAKRDTTDWYFTPQTEITRNPDNSVRVAMNTKWTGYAMAKALWMYEPGYRETLGVKKDEHSTLEDRECLNALLTTIENSKLKITKDPQLRILKEAAEKDLLDEYILFEIILPDNPYIAFQLSENTISGIKDYVLNVRNKRK